VPEELAAEVSWDPKTRLGWAHFPKFPAIVEKNSGKKEVAIQRGISRANGLGGPHHLAGVTKQAATVGVVVVAGGGGALEAGAKFLQKNRAKRVKAWITDFTGQASNVPIIAFNGGGFLGSAGEEGFDFFPVETAQVPALGIEPEAAVHRKIAFNLDEIAARNFGTGSEGVGVRPSTKGQHIASVAEFKFPIGFSVGGFFFEKFIHLPPHPRG
jgi:hypothetical protein